MSDRNPPLPQTNQPNDELFDRDLLTNSDTEFLAELDRVLAAESQPGGPVRIESRTGHGARDAIILSDITPEGSDPELTDDVSHRAESQEPNALDRAWQDLTDHPPEAATAAPPLFDPPAEQATAERRPSEDSSPLLELGPELEEGPPTTGPDAPERRAFTVELPTQVASTAAPADPPVTAQSRPAAKVPAPTPPTANVSGVWSRAALLLALVGLVTGGVGLWQAGVLNERIAHLETPDHSIALSATAPTEASGAPHLEVLQQKIDRLGSGLERLRADLPGGLARLQTQQGPEMAAIRAHLAELATQIKILQEANANRPSPVPPTSILQTTVIEGLKSELAEAMTQIKALQGTLVTADQRLQQVEQQLARFTWSRVQPRPATAPLDALQTDAAATRSPAKTPQGSRTHGNSRRLERAEQPVAQLTQVPAAPPSKATRTDRPNSGTWTVNLLSFRHQETAEKELARLGVEQQIRGQVASATHGGQTWYRVVVAGFSDFDSAKAYADEVRVKPGLSSAWIGRD